MDMLNMGITKETITKTIIVSKYTCDVCGHGCGSTVSQCSMCGKVLCYDCFVFDSREYGDYPDKYCVKCWSVGEKYREKIEALELEFDLAVESLEKDWKKESLGLFNG